VQEFIQEIYNFHGFSFYSCVVVTGRNPWPTKITHVRHIY